MYRSLQRCFQVELLISNTLIVLSMNTLIVFMGYRALSSSQLLLMWINRNSGEIIRSHFFWDENSENFKVTTEPKFKHSCSGLGYAFLSSHHRTSQEAFRWWKVDMNCPGWPEVPTSGTGVLSACSIRDDVLKCLVCVCACVCVCVCVCFKWSVSRSFISDSATHGLYSPPGSSVRGILQARTLECVAMPSSRGSSQSRDRTQVSRIAHRFSTIWATRQDVNYIIHKSLVAMYYHGHITT